MMLSDDRVARRLKFSELQAFIAVIEQGSIGKAAKQLNYSQPALSKSITNLERTLGVSLLERTRIGVQPTVHGDSLFKCGKAVINEVTRGLEELDNLSDPTSGFVHFGCTEPVSMSLVPRIMDRIARNLPRIVTQADLGEPTDLYPALVDRKTDFIILRLAKTDNMNLFDAETLYEEKMVIVCGSRHPLASKDSVELADLVNEHWILPKPTAFKTRLVTDAFSQNGFGAPKISMNDQNSPFQSLLIASYGRMLAIVPDTMLEAVKLSLPIKRLPVELDGSRRPVGIVKLKNRRMSPACNTFIEHVRSAAELLIDH